jgi:lipopolysaccharide export system protein LptA
VPQTPAPGDDQIDPFAPTATLERKGKTITAIKTSPDDQGVGQIEERDLIVGKLEQLDPAARGMVVGGQAVSLNEKTQMADGLKVGDGVTVEYVKDEDKPDQTPLARRVYAGERKGAVLQRFVFNDPAPFRVNVRFGKDARAYGSLALVEKIKDGNETVRLDGGSATYSEADDRLEIKPQAVPKAVEVRQGKSIVFGSRLEYDNDTGDANILGPNEISRSGDKPLKGQSQRMVYNVDDETLKMFGGIKLEQNGRTTVATSALVREKDGVAYLFGTDKEPVVSTDKNGTAKGSRIRYNLDTGDVVVEKPAGSEFNDQ